MINFTTDSNKFISVSEKIKINHWVKAVRFTVSLDQSVNAGNTYITNAIVKLNDGVENINYAIVNNYNYNNFILSLDKYIPEIIITLNGYASLDLSAGNVIVIFDI